MKTANLGITIKSVDERSRIVRGIASTGSLDRQGDIVEPLGARWRGADLPFLVSHNHSMVVGRVKFSPPTAKGIEFEAHLPEIREPGPLRDRVETAYQELKYGLIKSVSIGFSPEPGKVEQLPSGGLRFTEFEILELSMCAVGAQQDAEILEVRHNRARSGRLPVVKLDKKPSFPVVKLTKKDKLIGKWKADADRRAAARRRLGIPNPVVKLDPIDLVRAKASIASRAANRGLPVVKLKPPLPVVRLNRTR